MKRLFLAPRFGWATAIVAALTAAGSVYAAQIVTPDVIPAPAGGPVLDLEQSAVTFQQTSDVHFKGKTTLDRGLEVGFMAEVRLQGNACPRVGACRTEGTLDEVYISVSGSLGRLGFGTNAVVADEMGFLAPYGTRLSDPTRSLHAFRSLTLTSKGLDAAAASTPNVSYFTPRYGGMQLGISLSHDTFAAPEIELGILTPRELRDAHASVGFAANYAYGFDHVTLKLGGTYQTGSDDDGAPVNFEPGLRWGETRWGAGAQLDYALPNGRGALTFTGSYRDLTSGPFGGDWLLGDSVWDAGVQYARGRWSLGGYTIEGKSYSAEAGYQIGKGVQIAGGVQFWNLQTANGLTAFDPSGRLPDTKSTVVFIETALDF